MSTAPLLPSLAVGQLDMVANCPRRLANLLDPELRSAGGQPGMRLSNTIIEALQIAHRDALENENPINLDVAVPAGLSVEEQKLFARTLEQYDDAFGDEPGMLHERSGEVIRRPSGDRGFQLSGRIDLVFRVQGRPLEIRRIRQREAPTQPTVPRRGDIGLAALLRAPNETSDVVATVRTLWAHRNASVTEVEITGTQVRELREEINEWVDAARATPEEAVAGWWCTTCRFAHRCPAIAQTPIEQLFERVVESEEGASANSASEIGEDTVRHLQSGTTFAVIEDDADVLVRSISRNESSKTPDEYGDDW